MKTVHELNQRWWYRLLKVVYVTLAGITVLIVALAVYFSSNTNYVRGYKVTCKYGNLSTFVPAEKGISFSSYDPQVGVSSLGTETSQRILKECDITQSFLDKEAQSMKDTDASMCQVRSYFCNIHSTPVPYSINSDWVTESNAPTAVLYAILWVAVVGVLFEAVRRAFYYVVLGTLKPTRVRPE